MVTKNGPYNEREIINNYHICISNMTGMKHKGLVLLILLITGIGRPVLIRAQERDDFGIWSQIDLGARISDKWSGGLWFEHRSKENARTLDCALVMPYVNYKPYVSCELFTTDQWEKTRYYLGTTCKLGDRSTLDLFYLYYVMAGVPNRERHVLGLGYAFKI